MDYNEIICTAIDTIVTKRIEKMNFNRTIDGWIVSHIENNKYIVTDGKTQFLAYSINPDALYQEKDNIYILLLNNDYKENKIILSKKHYDTEKLGG